MPGRSSCSAAGPAGGIDWAGRVAPDGTAFNIESAGHEGIRASYRDRTPDRKLLQPGQVVKLTFDSSIVERSFERVFFDTYINQGVAGSFCGKEKGVTFVKVSKEDEAATAQKMKPILDDYVKTTKAKGLPGEEALKFCQDFLKKNP